MFYLSGCYRCVCLVDLIQPANINKFYGTHYGFRWALARYGSGLRPILTLVRPNMG